MNNLRLHPAKSIAQARTNSFSRKRRHNFFLVLTGFGCFAVACGTQANVIEDENLQPGTTAWELTTPADNRQIEGYASLTSVPVGGAVDLFVNTSDATYSLTVYRMGWYGGKGGRKLLGPVTLNGVHQVTPTADPTTLLIECHWTNPYTIHVPVSWVSGIYLVKLHGNTSGKESYITFTVRDTRNADVVFQQSVTTYQAYNPWPGYDPSSGYVGASLYGYQTSGLRQATQVSFNRPYGRGIQTNSLYGVGAGDFLTHDFGPVFNPEADLASGIGGTSAWEFCMLRWLEHHAYDVTYITSVDTHEDVNRLLRGKAFLSVGHDEYWTEQMKSNVFAARDQGVNLGFFSGNYVYWPVTFLADSNGTENRTLAMASNTGVCTAPAEIDCSVDSDCPTNLTCQPSGTKNVCSAATTTLCSADTDCPSNLICQQKSCDFNCLGESEQLLTGGMWDDGHNANGDIVINRRDPTADPPDAPLDHWVFANTGLKVNDVIPGLIGYEYDAYRSDSVPPDGLAILVHTQAPGFLSDDGKGDGGLIGAPFLPGFDGKSFDAWYDSLNFKSLNTACKHEPIPPFGLTPPDPLCSYPYPQTPTLKTDWAMTIYQASSGAYVFNAATVQWSWGLDDYFTGLTTSDGANNGPAVRTQCGYPWFHPNLVSCRNDAVAQITRNVLTKFQGQDTTAPQSTLTIGSPQYAGTTQLFVGGDTPFSLVATDDSSGVWNVWYRFFPSGTAAPTYTSVEGFLANFTLSDADGSFEVDSYATDNAGNDESPAHVQTVYLDTTPPVTTINAPVAKQYLHSDAFTISYTVDDGTGSGVKTAVPDIDGQTTLYDGTMQVTVANGLRVKLLTELTPGPHTFNVNSVDNVDNADTATVTFGIIVTPESIKTEVNQFFAMGAIRNHGLVNSLLAKLNAAANARARGNCRTASNNYVAFIHLLQAQSGKGVTAQAATILISDAQYLIAHCP
jgi:hypothetical protein